MNILLFIIILVVLIFVHELGHFLAAKRSGIRVDEFGFGYPPRLVGWRPMVKGKRGETLYSINLLPFGGFVKIFGEDYVDDEGNPIEKGVGEEEKKRSFVHARKRTQIKVLAAGVFFNFLFAWLLIAVTFMIGVPTATDAGEAGDGGRVVVTSVLPDSPAEAAGIMAGDIITALEEGGEEVVPYSTTDVQRFISSREGTLTLDVVRGDEEIVVEVAPEEGITENGRAIGIAMTYAVLDRMNPVSAVWYSLVRSLELTKEIVVGFGVLIGQAVTGAADFSQVAGPVGIVSLVGDASALGVVYLLTFTAFISLNLAVLNLIPFPALDGGRILFVLIEKIKGSPIKPKIAQMANLVGFGILILLMLVVTYNDIVRLL